MSNHRTPVELRREQSLLALLPLHGHFPKALLNIGPRKFIGTLRDTTCLPQKMEHHGNLWGIRFEVNLNEAFFTSSSLLKMPNEPIFKKNSRKPVGPYCSIVNNS